MTQYANYPDNVLNPAARPRISYGRNPGQVVSPAGGGTRTAAPSPTPINPYGTTTGVSPDANASERRLGGTYSSPNNPRLIARGNQVTQEAMQRIQPSGLAAPVRVASPSPTGSPGALDFNKLYPAMLKANPHMTPEAGKAHLDMLSGYGKATTQPTATPSPTPSLQPSLSAATIANESPRKFGSISIDPAWATKEATQNNADLHPYLSPAGAADMAKRDFSQFTYNLGEAGAGKVASGPGRRAALKDLSGEPVSQDDIAKGADATAANLSSQPKTNPVTVLHRLPVADGTGYAPFIKSGAETFVHTGGGGYESQRGRVLRVGPDGKQMGEVSQGPRPQSLGIKWDSTHDALYNGTSPTSTDRRGPDQAAAVRQNASQQDQYSAQTGKPIVDATGQALLRQGIGSPTNADLIGGKAPNAQGQRPTLDDGMALEYLQKAGGDKNKARQMAKADGHSF